jgi:sortase A
MPRLPAWRYVLRALLGLRVLILGFLMAAMILGSGHIHGLPAGLAPAERPRSQAVGTLPSEELAHAPLPTTTPSAWPQSSKASPAPTRTATEVATPTPPPTAAPSETPTATPPPSATPGPTEDTALIIVAPTVTMPEAGAQPAPTVVYPIGPPPVRLVIPSIGVDIPVITVGTVKQTLGGQTYEVWDTVANAAAYHKTSAPPGYIGNTVLNGHRDIHGAVFAHLDKVQVGDPITVYTDDHEFVYIVSEILEVPERYASAAQRAENQRLIGYIPEERLTLITCTPYGTNLNRLLVIARPAGRPGG